MGYLINCEYFNNLNRDKDMVRTGIMGDMYIPIPNQKSRKFSIPILIPSGDFLSKRERVRTIPMWTNLFAISNYTYDKTYKL